MKKAHGEAGGRLKEPCAASADRSFPQALPPLPVEWSRSQGMPPLELESNSNVLRISFVVRKQETEIPRASVIGGRRSKD